MGEGFSGRAKRDDEDLRSIHYNKSTSHSTLRMRLSAQARFRLDLICARENSARGGAHQPTQQKGMDVSSPPAGAIRSRIASPPAGFSPSFSPAEGKIEA